MKKYTINHLSLLKEYWGYDSFRGKQQEIIENVNAGIDTLAILPTGAGKSMCYQIPALLYDGLTIVVSPLIALMADQVEGLRKRGIRCSALMGNLNRHEVLYILEQAEFGAYDLLYVSPERLMSSLFRKRLPFLNITLIAVDEAHCISQWGYDFRPHYLRIAELRDFYPNAPIIALTASATTEVIKDICDKLNLNKPNIIKGDFSRENLTYLTRKVASKSNKVIEVINNVNGSIIVYVRYRKNCKILIDELSKHNIHALPYHAGMPMSERTKNQDLWMKNDCKVIVATSAFGMGVDKPDVRAVIHLDMPSTLEAYYQEAGRAGRDGLRSYAILLEDTNDVTAILKRVRTSFPPREYIEKVYQALANYYIVGINSGGGCVFPFNLIEFCAICKLHGPTVMAAIKQLEMANYITLLEDIENPSKLRITISRDALYYTKLPNPTCDRIIETLLRSYTGILNDAVHINEDTIATKLNLTRESVYSSLVLLDKCNILKYVPFKRTPLIIYNQDRVENEELYIPKELYEDRLKRAENRAESILHYAQQTDICRERVLMQYFDVDNGKNCGNCDICIKRKKIKLIVDKHIISPQYIKEICMSILKEKKSIPLVLFTDCVIEKMNLNYEEKKTHKPLISKEIRLLIESGTIHSNGSEISL